MTYNYQKRKLQGNANRCRGIISKQIKLRTKLTALQEQLEGVRGGLTTDLQQRELDAEAEGIDTLNSDGEETDLQQQELDLEGQIQEVKDQLFVSEHAHIPTRFPDGNTNWQEVMIRNTEYIHWAQRQYPTKARDFLLGGDVDRYREQLGFKKRPKQFEV